MASTCVIDALSNQEYAAILSDSVWLQPYKSAEERFRPMLETAFDNYQSILALKSPNPHPLNEMLKELKNLRLDGSYDAEYRRPSDFAFDRVEKLIRGSIPEIIAVSVSPNIYADGDGGIRIEWIVDNRELLLVIHALPNDKHYIYHESGDAHSVDYEVGIDNLRTYFMWLNNNDGSQRG